MLKTYSIYLIYTVAFLDLFSVSMVSVCLPHYLKNELGMSATVSGIVGSIYGFVQFFSSPVVGGWSDTHGYRRTLTMCLLFCAPAYGALISRSWTLIILSRTFAGCFKHTQNLSRTFLASFATESEKVLAYGRLNAMGSIGFILGPAVSAWLLNYPKLGYDAVYLLIAVTFLFNAFLVWTFLVAGQPSTPTSNNNMDKEDGGLVASFKRVNWEKHWDLFATRFLLSFVALLYRSSYNWMMSDKFHADAVVQSYLSSYQGLVAFFASYYCNRVCDAYGGNTLKVYVHSILLNLISMLGLLLAPQFYIYAAFLAPLCVATNIMRVVSLDLTTERCERNELGLILGASGSLTSIARCLSPALGGLLHDLDVDLPAVCCVVFVIISYVITVKYTYRNQAVHKQ